MADLRRPGWPRPAAGAKLGFFMYLTNGLSDRFGGLSAPIQGALLMTAAALCFSVMNIAIRLAAVELDPLQVAFFRNLFALMLMLPWLLKVGAAGLKTSRLKIHLWRSVLGLTAMLCWFYAIALLPLAEAVSLNFTVPLFATIGAALILREQVRARRWTATLVGFAGVLIILRPGFTELTPAMALPMIAALFMAVTSLMVKSLSRTESPAAIVLYVNLLLTPLSLVPALFVWRWPGLAEWPSLIAVGVLAALAHSLLTRAYTKADASAVMPFDYARLPFIALIAYVAFGEVPDIWVWLGGGIIAGSAIYIARREAQVARERPLGRAVRGAAAQAPRARL